MFYTFLYTKKNYILSLGLGIIFNLPVNDFTLFAQTVPPGKQWTKQWGTAAGDTGWGVTVDNNGNVYVTGATDAGLDNNPTAGSQDIFLTKYDNTGTKLWTRQWGTSANDVGWGIAIDGSGNIFITGYTGGGLDNNTNAGSEDIYLTKFDSAGTIQWTKQWGTRNTDYGYAVTTDVSGNIYVTGIANRGLDGNSYAGHIDIILTKFDSTGQKKWTRQWGAVYNERGMGVVTDTTGNIYVSGFTETDLDGNSIAGGYDALITKFNTDGTKQWTKLWGTSQYDYGYGISIDNTDNLYVTGYTNAGLSGNTNAGGEDIFLTKFDSAGTIQWTKQWGTTDDDYGTDVTVDGTGNVYVTGQTRGSLDSNPYVAEFDVYLTKYNSTGVKLWTVQWGTTGNESGKSVIVDTSGNIFVTGNTAGGLDGNVNFGVEDVFLTKFGTDFIPDTGIIQGTITDINTSNPIPGANIEIKQSGTTRYTLTSPANGTYTLPITVGVYEITVSTTGYTSDTKTGIVITKNQTTTVNFSLSVQIIPPDTTPPPIPTLLLPTNNLTTNYYQLFFDWSDVIDTETPPVSYELQVSTNINFSPDSIVGTATTSNSSSVISILSSGIFYWHVRARDNVTSPNYSNWTAAWTFTVDTPTGPVTDTIAPSGVTDLSTQPGLVAGDVNLRWTSPGDDGYTGTLNGIYKIQYLTSPGPWDKNKAQVSIPAVNVFPGTVSTYQLTNLSPGLYYFCLWTVDDSFNWSVGSNLPTVIVPQKVYSSGVTETNFGTFNRPVKFSTEVYEVKIYNSKGNLITELNQTEFTGGQIVWLPQDKTGNHLESGVYIYRAKTETNQTVYGTITIAK